MGKKRVVIADIRSMNVKGQSIGHYFTVAQNFLDIFAKNKEVCVAGGPIYEQRFKDNFIKLRFDSIGEYSILRNKLRVLYNMYQLFRICQNDVIVLQCSAVATSYLGLLLFKRPQTNVYMIQYNILGLNSIIKKFLYSLVKEKIEGIICPEPEIGKSYKRPYCVVPDYIYIGTSEQNTIPYEEKKYDFGMIGIISRDKGILEAARKLKNTDCKVLIAGHPQTEKIRTELQEICSDADNIELRLEYLSDDEYQKSITMSRYCILNYSGAYSEHSSGVVYDIIFKGTPVIGRRCKSLNFIESHALGQIFENIDMFDWENVLKEAKYEIFKSNIEKYYSAHEIYKSNLAKFLD